VDGWGMICNLTPVAESDLQLKHNTTMTTEQIAKLNKVFNRLESDIPLYLVIALSDAFKVTQEEIVRQYEAWQIA
jgi:hypothetical protein